MIKDMKLWTYLYIAILLMILISYKVFTPFQTLLVVIVVIQLVFLAYKAYRSPEER